MKKILSSLCLTAAVCSFAQQSVLHINNYSSYLLNGRLRANDVTNCLPELYMGNTLSSGNFTIPPYGMVVYDKYYTANLATYPVTDYLVRLCTTCSAGTLAYNDPNVIAMSPTSDWSFFVFFVRDPATQNILDQHELTMGSCNPSVNTYSLGSVSETEWFTISSGGVVNSYINIY